MTRLALTAGFLLLVAATASPVSPPGPGEVARLIENLGSPEFDEREAAAARLEELGSSAIDELRAACTSDNAEVQRRATELLRKAERRLANERVLVPTLVELDAKDVPLDGILAELSKQARCEIVLGGLKPEELASRKVTVSTGGKVSFWAAVLKVCDAGDLQVAGTGGFLAPSAMPYIARPKPGLRVAADPNRAVILQARGEAPRRPAAVSGAVLVEAIPFPKNADPQDQPSALLQVWPEPRLQWQATASAKVTRAADADGKRLTAEFVPVAPPLAQPGRDAVMLIRNPDGTVTVVKSVEPGFTVAGRFTPNAMQAVVRVKSGEKKPEVVNALGVSLFATIRGGVEPLCQAGGLKANGPAVAGTGVPNVGLGVSFTRDGNGKLVAEVELSYDPQAVHPARVSDELAGARGGTAPGFGNHTVHGLRVTDADGKPYGLGLSGGTSQFEPAGKRIVQKLKFELVPEKDGHGPPATVTFWGSYARPVEVPVLLRDVPLTGK